MIGSLILLLALLSPLPYPTSSWADVSYQECLKQLADAITEEATKVKRHRLAIFDFTDAQEQPTSVGPFLAEELGTQLMLAGELTVIDRETDARPHTRSLGKDALEGHVCRIR